MAVIYMHLYTEVVSTELYMIILDFAGHSYRFGIEQLSPVNTHTSVFLDYHNKEVY